MQAEQMENTKSYNCTQKKDDTHFSLLEKVDFLPIFIMGDHRSGTTLLYQLLVETQCFNFIRAYHIIKYDELVYNYIEGTENKVYNELTELFQSLGLSDRGFDRVKVTPDLPEEYGFILQKTGTHPPKISSDNLSIFIELCKKIQFISEPNRPLLLKNPWDFSNFVYLKNVFPNAKFIFIHRHPIHVINSKLKAVRSVLSIGNPYTALISQKYAEIFNKPVQLFLYRLLYSKYFDLGLRRVTQQAMESTTYYLQNIEALSNVDYISVKYEDICQEPEKKLINILEFLGLDAASTLADKSLIEPRSLQLLPEVDRNYHQISQKLQPYFAYHGYDS